MNANTNLTATGKPVRYEIHSVWKFDGKTPVKFSFTYDTEEEAEAYGRDCEARYGDQTFVKVGVVGGAK